MLIAVLTALSVVGRLLFGALPGFKPVTAMVVLTAMYFGSEAGFLTGALTAVLSNFYFGQGPWTPFQMFTWGLLGFVAGYLRNRLKSSAVFLAVYGAFAGVAFSLLMDVWTALWIDGAFNPARYGAAVATSLGYMAIYAVSNVVFLLLLRKPMGRHFWAESRKNTAYTKRITGEGKRCVRAKPVTKWVAGLSFWVCCSAWFL